MLHSLYFSGLVDDHLDLVLADLDLGVRVREHSHQDEENQLEDIFMQRGLLHCVDQRPPEGLFGIADQCRILGVYAEALVVGSQDLYLGVVIDHAVEVHQLEISHLRGAHFESVDHAPADAIDLVDGL